MSIAIDRDQAFIGDVRRIAGDVAAAHADAVIYDADDLFESRQKQFFPPAMSKFHTSTPRLAWIKKRLYCASEFVFQRDVDKTCRSALINFSPQFAADVIWEIERVGWKCSSFLLEN